MATTDLNLSKDADVAEPPPTTPLVNDEAAAATPSPIPPVPPASSSPRVPPQNAASLRLRAQITSASLPFIGEDVISVEVRLIKRCQKESCSCSGIAKREWVRPSVCPSIPPSQGYIPSSSSGNDPNAFGDAQIPAFYFLFTLR